MIGPVLCALAFLIAWAMATRSASYGLLAVLAFGYAYGIVRANVLNSFTYFVFDAAVTGFYLGYAWQVRNREEKRRTREVIRWTAALILWPVFIGLVPFQTPLVTLVGLRGNIFLLPFLMVGARLRASDLKTLSCGLSVLNLAALAMAALEYVKGVQAFYPQNAVTAIIYNSNDVAGHQFLRIPATFVTAHAFGGAMVATLPLLFGAWTRIDESRFVRSVALCGILAAAVGVLLSATRINFVLMSVLVIAAMFLGGIKGRTRWALIAVIVAVGALSLNNERMQRFKNLSDTDAVAKRIDGSVNRSFLEIFLEYPLGNGLGGGGTSIPEFLLGQVHQPIAMESEYARILLEQGSPGLLLWLGFIAWFGFQTHWRVRSIWQTGRKLSFYFCISGLFLGALGIGMMTSIPETVVFLLMMGWTAAPPRNEEFAPRVSPRPAFPKTRRDPVCLFAGGNPAFEGLAESSTMARDSR